MAQAVLDGSSGAWRVVCVDCEAVRQRREVYNPCMHALPAQVAGDGQELGALEAWYGREGGRTPERPLLIGSVKSNMGHCEGCSGLAGACMRAGP